MQTDKAMFVVIATAKYDCGCCVVGVYKTPQEAKDAEKQYLASGPNLYTEVDTVARELNEVNTNELNY